MWLCQCLGELQRPVTFSIKVCFLPEGRNIPLLIAHTHTLYPQLTHSRTIYPKWVLLPQYSPDMFQLRHDIFALLIGLGNPWCVSRMSIIKLQLHGTKYTNQVMVVSTSPIPFCIMLVSSSALCRNAGIIFRSWYHLQVLVNFLLNMKWTVKMPYYVYDNEKADLHDNNY